MMKEKTILGLDVGISSLGWALVKEDSKGQRIITALGCRIIPLNADDKDEFSKGNAITKNQKRTTRRSQRKGYFRYKLRRKSLLILLEKLDMNPEELMEINSLQLYGLRDKAASSGQKVSLKELGRIFYHLNQKRGYKSSRSDVNLDKKDTEFVAEVKNRHQLIKDTGLTVGQYFYTQLTENNYQRIKQQVFPREAYIEEFDTIINEQKKYYPDILVDNIIEQLRNRIIYYQRPLKSQKGLVSVCEFEGLLRKNKHNKEVFTGPKVAPKSSPLFQVCKIWETINTITLKNKKGENLYISNSQKQELFRYLDAHKVLTYFELYKILGLKKEDGWYGNKQLIKGLQGNTTKAQISEYLKGFEHLLRFELDIQSNGAESYLVDKKTGEVKGIKQVKFVSPTFESEPFYQLWHTIYSIGNIEDCIASLQSKFNLPYQIADTLARIDLTKSGFGNKSAKAMRKILPYLMEGDGYSIACNYAGYNHSNSFTKDEKLTRPLVDKLPLLKKNALRQPVVEKILNQLINLVNAITEEYGVPDEIRIELARELKQSKEERNETFASISKRERENKSIIERIEKEYRHFGIRASRNNILKWRLFNEINNQENKLNATCIYCGNPFSLTDALSGNAVDVEHIIPKSKFFDDSQSNKTLVHRKCNEDKDNMTAFDFMAAKGEVALMKYIERIDSMYRNKIISKSKRDKLLMASSKIPQDFIDRDLKETQYIARKAKEILEGICYNVWSTSGKVTGYLRRIWGWNDVLMNLQLPKYKKLNQTEWKEVQKIDGQIYNQEVIKGWSKRNDHRHHAIDALVVACTQQGYIQRINTLSSEKTRNMMRDEISEAKRSYDQKKGLLESYIYSMKPFTTKEVEEAVKGILVSFKAGKRVVVRSRYKAKGKNLETGILVPKGALSEESVYGKIKNKERRPLRFLFENPDLIYKSKVKALVEDRLNAHKGNLKKALDSIKKDPIYLDRDNNILLEYGTCYKDEYVIKYQIKDIKARDVSFIVDEKIKKIIKERLERFGNNEKEAFKTILWFNEEKKIPIKSVRCFTGLSALEPVKKDEKGNDIGFVKPGNNHHVAFYTDENGKKVEHICTFWHAVERKKFGFPVVIDRPSEIWEQILDKPDNYPQFFLTKLPGHNWLFDQSVQQNEMFILGAEKEELQEMLLNNNKKLISSYLYRVQKVSASDYTFRHHIETEINDSNEARESKRFYRCKSIGSFNQLNPVKIILDNLGNLTKLSR